MRNNIERLEFHTQSLRIKFAKYVDKKTRELTNEAYNEILNEFGVKLL